MKPLIFTSFNDDIDPKFFQYQQKIIDKFDLSSIYKPLHYKWHHSEMLHGDILNKFVNKAFYELGYDTILIMDVDCIPLSKGAVEHTFEAAQAGALVGNAQRSEHLDSDRIYAASSYICFTEETYKNLGRPNFLPNNDGDTCEQLTINARERGVDVVLFMPNEVDSPNEKGEYFELDDETRYGIGTTFGPFYDNRIGINYHLFGSRLNLFNNFFFKKCESILNPTDVPHNQVTATVLSYLQPMDEVPLGKVVFGWYKDPSGNERFIDIYKIIRNSDGKLMIYSDMEGGYVDQSRLQGWVGLYYENSSVHDL